MDKPRGIILISLFYGLSAIALVYNMRILSLLSAVIHAYAAVRLWMIKPDGRTWAAGLSALAAFLLTIGFLILIFSGIIPGKFTPREIIGVLGAGIVMISIHLTIFWYLCKPSTRALFKN